MLPILGTIATTPKPEQAHTHTNMKNKDGLLHKLATSMATCYHNTLHDSLPQCKGWDDIVHDRKEHLLAAMSDALPKALRQEMPYGYPTRAHLRSHLSILHEGRQYPTIIGFDDLYEDVKLCIDAARHEIPDGANDQHNQSIQEIEELRVLLDNTSKSLQAAIRERNVASDALKSVRAERDEERKRRNENLAWATRAENRLAEANGRISELEAGCDESADMWQPTVVDLQQKLDRERLVVDVQARILQRIATVCGMTEGNGEDLIKKIVAAKAAGDKLKAEVAHLRDIKRVLEEKISKLRGEPQSHSDNQGSEIARLSELASSRLKDVGELRGANIKLTADAASVKDAVKNVLEEFGMESPTDDILDMVRAACEGVRELRAHNTALGKSLAIANQTGGTMVQHDNTTDENIIRTGNLGIAPLTATDDKNKLAPAGLITDIPIPTPGHVRWESHRDSKAFGGNRVVEAFGDKIKPIPSRIYGAVPRVYTRAGDQVTVTARPEDRGSDCKCCCWPMGFTIGICLIGPPIILAIGKFIGA